MLFSLALANASPSDAGMTRMANGESERSGGATPGRLLVRAWRSPGFHRAMSGLVLLTCAFFAWRGWRSAARGSSSDFTIYHAAGRALLEGRSVLDVKGYIYLPFFALCMAPLAVLPLPVAAGLWQIASLAALVWAARMCLDLVSVRDAPLSAALAWTPLLCVLRLADSNFGNGQVNTIVLALVVRGLLAWRSGRERAAGGWIGVAAALKIVPGCLVLHLVLRGAQRAIVWTAVSALSCVLLVPALFVGWERNIDELQSWFHEQSAPYFEGGRTLLEEREYLPGQSLTAALYRLLAHTPATSRKAEGPAANLVDLDPESVKWIVRGAELLVLAMLVAALVRSQRSHEPRAWVREAALVMTAALTLAPLVHKAHMVWLILPYTVLLSGAPAGLSRAAAWARWSLVALSVLLAGATAPAILGRTLATWQLAHNAVFLGLACVFAALLFDVWCASRAASPLDPSAR